MEFSSSDNPEARQLREQANGFEQARREAATKLAKAKPLEQGFEVTEQHDSVLQQPAPPIPDIKLSAEGQRRMQQGSQLPKVDAHSTNIFQLKDGDHQRTQQIVAANSPRSTR